MARKRKTARTGRTASGRFKKGYKQCCNGRRTKVTKKRRTRRR